MVNHYMDEYLQTDSLVAKAKACLLYTSQRTGTLETYLPQVEEYLEGVRQAREQEKEKAEVTLTVSECGDVYKRQG